MSVQIESIDELKALVKRLGIKVESVEQLRDLLTTVNSQYDPEAARIRALKLTGVITAAVGLGAAGMVSFFLVAPKKDSDGIDALTIAALGIIWGVAGLVTLITQFFTTWGLRGGLFSTSTVRAAQPGLGGPSHDPGTPTRPQSLVETDDGPASLVTRPKELT